MKNEEIERETTFLKEGYLFSCHNFITCKEKGGWSSAVGGDSKAILSLVAFSWTGVGAIPLLNLLFIVLQTRLSRE